MNRRYFLSYSLATAGFLAGCSSSESQDSSEKTSTPSPTEATATPEEKASTTTPPPKPNIELVDASLPEVVNYGETFEIELTFRNLGSKGSYVDTWLVLGDSGFEQNDAGVGVKVPAESEVTATVEIQALTLGAETITLQQDSHIKTTTFQIQIDPLTYPFAQPYTYHDGLKIRILDMETPSKLEVRYYDGNLVPDEGEQFVLYHVEFKNTADSDIVAYHGLFADGEHYSPSFELPSLDIDASYVKRRIFTDTIYLPVDETYTGWALFEIPDDINPADTAYGRLIDDEIPIRWSK